MKKQPHFGLNKSQRNGVVLLVLVIAVLLGIIFWVNQHKGNFHALTETSHYQHYIDSLKQAKKQQSKAKKDTIYPFNPNFITDYKGYVLGMTAAEVDRITAYRKQGKWINSASDFQNVSGISDSLFHLLRPALRFPEWVTRKQAKKVNTAIPISKKGDLNTASIEELQKVRGVGPVLAQRIVRYRTKIGGFVHEIQLKDVYGVPFETEDAIKNAFAVKTPVEVAKININTASVIDLSEVIYFDYELAREIIQYRELHGGIKNFEELIKIDNFPGHKIDRIKLYLSID